MILYINSNTHTDILVCGCSNLEISHFHVLLKYLLSHVYVCTYIIWRFSAVSHHKHTYRKRVDFVWWWYMDDDDDDDDDDYSNDDDDVEEKGWDEWCEKRDIGTYIPTMVA